MIILPIHANETIWQQWLYATKIMAKFTWKLTYVFQEWSYAHLSNFNSVCALSNLVSLFIKFDVRSKHAFTSFFLMFTKYAQQTKNVFAAAYSTEITVWCRWMLWPCLSTWSWGAFSCSLDEICSVSRRGWKFHFRDITMPHICDNVPITHVWNV